MCLSLMLRTSLIRPTMLGWNVNAKRRRRAHAGSRSRHSAIACCTCPTVGWRLSRLLRLPASRRRCYSACLIAKKSFTSGKADGGEHSAACAGLLAIKPFR